MPRTVIRAPFCYASEPVTVETTMREKGSIAGQTFEARVFTLPRYEVVTAATGSVLVEGDADTYGVVDFSFTAPAAACVILAHVTRTAPAEKVLDVVMIDVRRRT